MKIYLLQRSENILPVGSWRLMKTLSVRVVDSEDGALEVRVSTLGAAAPKEMGRTGCLYF